MYTKLVIIVVVVVFANSVLTESNEDPTTELFDEFLESNDTNTDVVESEIKYYYFTNKSLGIVCSLAGNNVSQLEECDYRPLPRTLVIVHGWSYLPENGIVWEVIETVYKNNYDINIISVNWQNYSNQDYFAVKEFINPVGDIIGEFINILKKKYGESEFIVVGNSLGAHLAGRIGYYLDGQLDVILGLDPSMPLFLGVNDTDRLDATDAKFVQVIHTSSIGVPLPHGTADYYVNGGMFQPGCDPDNGCSHLRAMELFLDAMNLAHVCKAKLCTNILSYVLGDCVNNQDSFMGALDVDKNASGIYQVLTGNASPFCTS